MTELQKAEVFRVDDTSKKVVCQFNPKDFTITKSVKWIYQQVDGKDVGDPEFAGGQAQDFTTELWFDSTNTGQDVRKLYQELLRMAEIDAEKKDPDTRKSEPPLCKLQWGSYLSFTGVIKQMSQSFTMFKADGTPLRAKVGVTFSETPKEKKKQNPTTGSESRKIWIVHEGQTLDWIAYQEYGSSAYWRHIAETNDLANPLALHPGQVLRLLPLP